MRPCQLNRQLAESPGHCSELRCMLRLMSAHWRQIKRAWQHRHNNLAANWAIFKKQQASHEAADVALLWVAQTQGQQTS